MTRENSFLSAIDKLYETSRLLNEYESIPRKYGTEDELFMVEAHIINLIGNNQVNNISGIAKQMNRTKSSASQNITRLVKKGLVKKEKSAHSSREISIILTPKGEQVFQFHKNLDDKELNSYLTKLENYNTKDFENIDHFLTIINENIIHLLGSSNND
ncbi:MarR family winged helix-turn-helix transcriptional regulator [Staphylococcus caeli]|uniref:MarR family winged helix-turn-helix transcriptional regulator n=1 Tax=Staphylococcus caeli TaxID=2201815 RepID=UPI003F56D73D